MAPPASPLAQDLLCPNEHRIMSIEPVQKLRVLFLEDDPNDRELVARALAADHLDCEFTYATTERGFLEGDTIVVDTGDGTFTRITTGSLVNDGGSSAGCAWADYDNDGFPDLFITCVGQSRLFRNTGKGTFVDVTRAAVQTATIMLRFEEELRALHDLGLGFLWHRHKPEAKTVGDAALRHTEHQPGRLKLVGFKMENPSAAAPKDGINACLEIHGLLAGPDTLPYEAKGF